MNNGQSSAWRKNRIPAGSFFAPDVRSGVRKILTCSGLTDKTRKPDFNHLRLKYANYDRRTNPSLSHENRDGETNVTVERVGLGGIGKNRDGPAMAFELNSRGGSLESGQKKRRSADLLNK